MSIVEYTSKDGRFTSRYDSSIKPGDVITAYHKGYWKVDKVNDRGKHSAPLIEYTRIGKKGKNSCDAGYCTKIDPEVLYHEQVKEAGELRAMLMKAQEQ